MLYAVAGPQYIYGITCINDSITYKHLQGCWYYISNYCEICSIMIYETIFSPVYMVIVDG